MRIYGSAEILNKADVARRVNEGFFTYNINTSDVTLVDNAHHWISAVVLSSTYGIVLPNATVLSPGWEVTFYVDKTSTHPLLIKTFGNNTLYTLGVTRAITLVLLRNDTQAGTWKVVAHDKTYNTLRNVLISSATDILTTENNQVRVNSFVSTISNGFILSPDNEVTGIPDERMVYFKPNTAYYVTPPESFPAVTYLYQKLDNTLVLEAYGQDGGTEFPNVQTNGYIFYNKALGCNYKYANGTWAKYPVVAIGCIEWQSATVFSYEVYPFNFWFWDVIDFNEALPDQSGNATRFLSTDGTNSKWDDAQILLRSVSNVPPLSPVVGDQFINTTDNKLYTYLTGGTWDSGVDPITNRTYIATDTNVCYSWYNNNLHIIGSSSTSAAFVIWQDVDVYQVSDGNVYAYTSIAGEQSTYVSAGVSLYTDNNLTILKGPAEANTWTYTGVIS